MKLGLIGNITESGKFSFSSNEFRIENNGSSTVMIGVYPLRPEGFLHFGFSSEKIDFSENITFDGGAGNLLIIGIV